MILYLLYIAEYEWMRHARHRQFKFSIYKQKNFHLWNLPPHSPESCLVYFYLFVTFTVFGCRRFCFTLCHASVSSHTTYIEITSRMCEMKMWHNALLFFGVNRYFWWSARYNFKILLRLINPDLRLIQSYSEDW